MGCRGGRHDRRTAQLWHPGMGEEEDITGEQLSLRHPEIEDSCVVEWREKGRVSGDTDIPLKAQLRLI